MVLTEYDEDYEEMKELVEEALREGKTIKVRAKGLFELNPFHLEGEVAARSQFLGHQMLERIELKKKGACTGPFLYLCHYIQGGSFFIRFGGLTII